MNEKGTNFCSLSVGLEPATSAQEAVTHSIPPLIRGRGEKFLFSYQCISVGIFLLRAFSCSQALSSHKDSTLGRGTAY